MTSTKTSAACCNATPLLGAPLAGSAMDDDWSRQSSTPTLTGAIVFPVIRNVNDSPVWKHSIVTVPTRKSPGSVAR